MKLKTDLFHLIRAMSKSEKRYFTLDAQKSGRKASNYLELFRAINDLEEYDEAVLKEKFGPSLPFDKAYLYDAILRSMRDYRSSKSRAAKIKEMILDAKYLYERGLYEQSEARLEQAKVLASELDDQLALLEINRETMNYVWVMKKENYGSTIEQLLLAKDQNIDNINEELLFLSLCYRLNMAIQSKQAMDKKALEEEFSAELFSPTHQIRSAHAERRYLQSMAFFSELQGAFDKAYEYFFKMVDWWDKHPAIKEEEYARYIADISNLLYACYTRRKYEYFPDLLEKLENETPGNYHDQRLIFRQLTNYKLIYFINFGVSAGAEKLVQQVEHGMTAYKLNQVSKLYLTFNVCLLLFIIGDHPACRDWSAKVIKLLGKKEERLDFRLSAQLILLLAVYEEDDIDRIDSTLRSIQRNIRGLTDNDYMPFFHLVVRYIKRLINSPLEKQAAVLEKLLAAIQQMKQEKKGIAPLGLDELLQTWINSKRNNKSLQQLFRENVGG